MRSNAGVYLKDEMKLLACTVIGILAIGMLAGPSAAAAEQSGKIHRVGYLRFRSDSPTTDPHYIAFRQELDKLGYVEGQNLVIEYRSAEGNPKRIPHLVAELVRLKVDVIVTSPDLFLNRVAGGVTLLSSTPTVPVVMVGIRVDPVEAGLVAGLARPGANITGVMSLERALHTKRLELLKAAVPRVYSAAFLWTPSEQLFAWTRSKEQPELKEIEAAGPLAELEAAGRALGIEIKPLAVTPRHLGSLEDAFSAISQARPDALLVASSQAALDHRARIIEFTAKRGLPAIYAESRFVEAGGLMSYGANLDHLYRQAAHYVAKIQKGAKPAGLPIEQPRKFDLVVNLKTAKQLGITIPAEVLYRADRLIRQDG